MRGVIAALAALSLCACNEPQAPAPAQPEPATEAAWTLSPEGYGPVRIGMSIAEASAALGAELVADGSPEPDICETYHLLPEAEAPDGLRFLAQNGRLSRITDHGSPDVRTPEGVGVGASDAEVRAAYPGAIEAPAKYDPPPAHSLTVWRAPDESGLRFEISAEGVVTTMHAGDESIRLVEGCA